MKKIVVAYDANRVIGRQGELPWGHSLPADLRHFREETVGGTVIMGRKTFESLPESMRPLPQRQNIVLSLGQTAFEGALHAHSLEEAYALAEHEQVSIIGGEQIYRLALPTVDQIIATEIDTNVSDGDAVFPELPSDEWDRVAVDSHPSDGKNAFNYSFVTYLRRHSTDLK